MSYEFTLFTGQWADLLLEDLAAMASSWGYDGLELACWGDHFEVEKALADEGYCRSRQEILERNHLNVLAIGAHLVGQAVCDRIDARHQAILPPEIYGDGEQEGVRTRAAERMKDTARAAAGSRPAVLRHRQPPDGPGGLRPRRRAPPCDPAGACVG